LLPSIDRAGHRHRLDGTRAQLRQELIDLHEQYRVDNGLRVERPYLLTLGTKR